MNRKHRIKVEEWYAVTLSFIFYFCILGAYYVMRPIRDQLAVKVGSEELPLFFSVTFVVTLILTPLFAQVVSLWPRRIIIPTIYVFFMSCQLIFIPFFYDQSLLSAKILGLLFFVWVSVFNLFMVSIFWSFMADIWNDAQARRLFPIIALGGTFGALIGPIITRSLVEIVGLAFLLLISSSLLMIGVICVFLLGNWAYEFGIHRNDLNSESAIGGGMLDGLKQVVCNSFIRSMSLMMLLNDAIGTIAYALITDYSGISFPNDTIAQTRFAANVDLSTNIVQIVVQLTVTRWLLIHYGAGRVFVVWSLIVVPTCFLMVFVQDTYKPFLGTFPILALVLIVTRSLSHGMLQPARETLYTLVSRDLRYKGKNAVDTVVWRAGDVISLLSINGFRVLGINLAGFGIIWAALATTSGLIGWRLAKGVEK